MRRCHARGVPGPQTPLLEKGPGLEILKIGPRSVPLDADYLTGENVLEKHAQRKYTKPLYLQSGIAGDCVFRQKGYGPGFTNALASPLKTPSSPTERGSYRLIKRRTHARCVEKELLARRFSCGREAVPLRVPADVGRGLRTQTLLRRHRAIYITPAETCCR